MEKGFLHRKVHFFGFGLDTWAKMILVLKFAWNLMSNGWAMLESADAKFFARKMPKKVIFFFAFQALSKKDKVSNWLISDE